MSSNLIIQLLDMEKDLREAEACLSTGSRRLSWSKDEQWFLLMEELGFLVDGKFLPVIDILDKTKSLSETVRAFTLEAVACDLWAVYQVYNHE